ncbi:MAG: EAL domain-containing protein [Candidatus Thiodiazotropha endolucinida]
MNQEKYTKCVFCSPQPVSSAGPSDAKKIDELVRQLAFDEKSPEVSEDYWEILVVDDEPDWHTSIRMALEGVEIEGRPLKLYFALSREKALRMLGRQPGIALLLLDVVMESEHAGLNLVQDIRERLGNETIQIAIVTGQPAYAPEPLVVERYQINDYRLKTDLSAAKLTALVCTGIRAYKSLCALIETQEKLKGTALALYESEKKYHDLYDLAPDMYATVELDSAQISQCNQALVENLGFTSKNEIIGKTIFDIHQVSCLNKTQEAFRLFAEKGQVQDAVLSLRHKDGSGIDVSLKIVAIYDEQANIVEGRASWRDITERKKSEAALRESEERYRAIFGQAAVGFASVSLDGSWMEVNDRLCEIVGYSREKLLDRAQHDIAHPDDVETCLDLVRQTFNGELQNFSMELRCMREQGEMVWVNLSVSLVRGSNGQPKHFVFVIEDIDQRKQAEEKLRQAAAVFMNTAEGVIITNLDGTIIDVNQAYSDITGYSNKEALGQNPRILKSGRHDPSFYELMWHELKQTGNWRGEIWNRRKDGSVYPELLTISAVKEESGNVVGYVGVFTDITSDKKAQEQLYYLVHHDPLTGLPNRLLFNAQLSQSIKHAARDRAMLAIIFLDLDLFKHINESMGHEVGDELLVQVAYRLAHALRSSDIVARVSGDEFVLLLEDLKQANDASMMIVKLMDKIKKPFVLQDQRISITCSAGISLYPEDGETPVDLLRNADAAMHQAKEEGRSTYQFYKSEMTASAFEHILLESALRTALDQDEMRLVYQPQVDLITDGLVGMEALLRWDHPQQGVVSPARFIPIAEQSGLIHEIGVWVLRSACIQGKAWLDQGFAIGRIAVNVSASQLQFGDFVALVHQILDETGLPAKHLTLEVTERFMMSKTREGVEQLKALQSSGIEIAIDDFGTGYSSMSQLKQLPINKLKIDKSFIRDIPVDSDDMAISEAVIALGKALNMKVIAEGVETEAQSDFLKEKGCEEAQGYLYSAPIDVDDIKVWLKNIR